MKTINMTREEQIDNAAVIARPFGNSIEHCCWRDGFRKGAEWADGNRWVSMEEGLPDTNEKFQESDHLLCYDEGTGTMFIGWYNSFHGKWYVSHFRANNEAVTVTHYSLRPEPPKAEQ